MKLIRLSELLLGQSAILKEIKINGLQRRRLLDFGFIKDSEIQVAQRSPLGDPTAYWIKGALIALRKEETDNIFVEVNQNAKGQLYE
ncbi:ferrous iron transport protein A [bacterium]|nr:ferrous iron transport protein A [bacterium]